MTADALCNNILLRSFIWQSTAFVLAGLLASYILRRNPARAHQALLTAVAAALLAPTFSQLVRHYGLGLLADSSTAVAAPAAEAYPTDDDITIPQQIFNNCYRTVAAADDYPRDHEFTASGPISVRPCGIAWRTFLAWAWIAVSAALLFRLVVTFALGLRLLRRSTALGSPRILQAARIAGEKLALNTRIDLRSSADIRSPVIWCWTARPVLLVPAEARRQNGSADWVGLFCHELAHFKRFDHFTGLVANFIVSLFPWHPLLWRARQRLAELSEQACDDWVLATGQSGPEYAESLLGFWPVSQPALLPGLRGPKGDLKMRIHRIVKDTCSNPRIGPRWTLLVCIIGVCLAIGMALAQAQPADAEGKERERPNPEARERPVVREGEEARETKRDSEEPGRGGSPELSERKVHARQLEQRASEIERTLKGLRDDQDNEARDLQAELREIRAEMDRIQAEFRGIAPEKRLPEGERMLRDADPRTRELMQHRRELQERTAELERKIGELGEDRPERKELKAELKEISQQMQKIDLDLRGQREPGPEARMIIEQREEILQAIRQLSSEYKELAENHPKRQEINSKLKELKEKLGAIQKELDRRGGREGAPREGGELIQRREELRGRAEQVEREIGELGEDNPGREKLRLKLQGIAEQIRKIDVEIGRPGDRAPIEGRQPRDAEPQMRELMQHRRDLDEKASQIERKIRDIAKERPDDAERLKVDLRQIKKEAEAIDRELSAPGRDRPREIGREPRDLEGQVDQLRGELNDLRGQMTEIRRLLEQLLERQQPRLRPLDEPAERR
jgi:beta-lactamase regulating signal transducer with metallopeptidase domain/predicted  nucleic acid-binding Zn-ribbon protein